MALLRAAFTDAGATDVVTLLNSGNVVFTGRVDAAALEKRIANDTGVTTSVLVIDAARFRRIAAAFPFEGDESTLTITFMSNVPAIVEVPEGLAPELVAIGAEAVYQSLPDGISKSKLKPSFWRQFGADATARNLRTVSKLLVQLEQAPPG
jgi:uncharacterized protein (DUF1697 family)